MKARKSESRRGTRGSGSPGEGEEALYCTDILLHSNGVWDELANLFVSGLYQSNYGT